jgi:hypothetical protein
MGFDIPENLDIYEVDKADYNAYFYRLPQNEMVKTTPREGFVVYRDMIEPQLICGILSENIMAMPANRYFIFNFIDEERLGPHKQYKYIQMSEAEYIDFLKRLQEITKEKKENA